MFVIGPETPAAGTKTTETVVEVSTPQHSLQQETALSVVVASAMMEAQQPLIQLETHAPGTSIMSGPVVVMMTRTLMQG